MTGNMRQGSRSPPFLIVGLLVALCILAFNYWNISNKNGDLKRQFEELQIDFRTVTDKHLKVETRASDLTARLSEMQSNKDQVDKDLAEKNKRVQDLTNEVQSLQQELKTVKENLQKAEANSQNVVQEKQSLNGELEKLKAELTELKNAPVHCDQQACRDPIRALITALTTHIGKPAVAGALKQNNVEVMQIAADLLEGADQQQNQPKLPEAADGQQRQAGQQQPPAGQPPAQEKQERNNAQETAKKDDENKDENKEETENEKTDAEDKKKEEEPRDLQEAEKHFETQKAEKSLLTLAGTDRNNRNNFTALTLLTRDQGNTIVEKMQFPGQLSAKKSIQRPSNAISNLEDEEEDLEKESTDFDDAVQTTTLTLTREVEERENIISLNGPIKTKDFPADQGLKRENVDAVRVDSRRSSSEQIGKTAV